MEFYLPVIWSAIIGLGVVIYVILDGFDLGVGILFPFRRDEKEKDAMMNSIAPFWDGNETWLVLGGAGLFGAFPVAYSVILPALYIPIVIFLVALIMRGVSFEFRFKATGSKLLWDWVFGIGSALMAFGQGIVLGAFVQGFKFDGKEYVGGSFDWLTPFSFFCGIALVVGYALLGATWLIMKTEDPLQNKMRKIAVKLSFAMIAQIGIVSAWTPLSQPEIFARWFTQPNFYVLLPVPLLTLVTSIKLLQSLRAPVKEISPFVYTICLFILSYFGLVISIWPYVVPRGLTIWDASSPVASQMFILVGTLIILPLVLTYTYHVYKLFRGKVNVNEGYHH